jgi:hypothetical protein
MNTDEMLKYLGCAVLGLLLIYLVTVILKVNNNFIGSVLGGNFIEGLSNKDQAKEGIENQLKKNEKLIKELNDGGADFTENKDLITKLIASYQEMIIKNGILRMTRGEDQWSVANLTKNLQGDDNKAVAYLTVLNDTQEFIDA